MRKLERFALLSAFMRELSSYGSWCGETHVQKATYLAQAMLGVPFGFDFVLYKHGPYSFDLRDEITAMRADDVVILRPQGYPYGPTLVPTSIAERMEESAGQVIDAYRNKLEFVAEVFGSKGVAELERLATAFYVTLETGMHASAETRANRLQVLKPHIPLSEARKAIEVVDGMSDKARTLGIA